MTGPDTQYYAIAGAGVAGAGTVDVSGSTGVIGTGTDFGDFAPGDIIAINGEEHTIGAVATPTGLATVGAWAQTVSGASFTYYSLQTTLLSAGIPFPKGPYAPFSQPLDLGDGSLRGGGWPTAEWQWKFITRAQRQLLRAYLPAVSDALGAASGQVRFRTRVNESSDAFVTFRGQMIWPYPETLDAQRRVPFALKFRALVDLS